MADYLKPLPVPEVETEPFWAACKEHRLDIQQCDDCSIVRLLPEGHLPSLPRNKPDLARHQWARGRCTPSR